MKTIHVSASTEYDVLVGSGLMDRAAEHIRNICHAHTLCIVSDETVWSLYGQRLLSSLAGAGYRCLRFCFSAGEQSKNLQTYGSLLAFLANNNLTRSDCIIALGGGVTGDLAGFAAATYLRGIDYIQIPTTLMAMVDSSVGGKTAIDLPCGKNLAGAFHQPKLVLCDTDTLSTLPDAVFLDGCAEVIKYGILYDPALFNELETQGIYFNRVSVIARCIEHKRDVVAADEFDKGQRMFLNFGHTIGHGIEAASDYQISHGSAVAMGMAMISYACAVKGICSMRVHRRIIKVLDDFRLNPVPSLPTEDIVSAAFGDKKRCSDSIRLIVCKDIGQCDILTIPAEVLPEWIQVGLQI